MATTMSVTSALDNPLYDMTPSTSQRLLMPQAGTLGDGSMDSLQPDSLELTSSSPSSSPSSSSAAAVILSESISEIIKFEGVEEEEEEAKDDAEDLVAERCREYFEQRLKNSETLKKRWSVCSSDSGADSGDSDGVPSLLVHGDTMVEPSSIVSLTPATFTTTTTTTTTAATSTSNSGSSLKKMPLDEKMEFLRKEIASLMNQDNALFKQLLTLHDSIKTLKSQPPHHRPSSPNSFDSFTEEEEDEDDEDDEDHGDGTDDEERRDHKLRREQNTLVVEILPKDSAARSGDPEAQETSPGLKRSSSRVSKNYKKQDKSIALERKHSKNVNSSMRSSEKDRGSMKKRDARPSIKEIRIKSSSLSSSFMGVESESASRKSAFKSPTFSSLSRPRISIPPSSRNRDRHVCPESVRLSSDMATPTKVLLKARSFSVSSFKDTPPRPVRWRSLTRKFGVTKGSSENSKTSESISLKTSLMHSPRIYTSTQSGIPLPVTLLGSPKPSVTRSPSSSTSTMVPSTSSSNTPEASATASLSYSSVYTTSPSPAVSPRKKVQSLNKVTPKLLCQGSGDSFYSSLTSLPAPVSFQPSSAAPVSVISSKSCPASPIPTKTVSLRSTASPGLQLSPSVVESTCTSTQPSSLIIPVPCSTSLSQDDQNFHSLPPFSTPVSKQGQQQDFSPVSVSVSVLPVPVSPSKHPPLSDLSQNASPSCKSPQHGEPADHFSDSINQSISHCSNSLADKPSDLSGPSPPTSDSPFPVTVPNTAEQEVNPLMGKSSPSSSAASTPNFTPLSSAGPSSPEHESSENEGLSSSAEYLTPNEDEPITVMPARRKTKMGRCVLESNKKWRLSKAFEIHDSEMSDSVNEKDTGNNNKIQDGVSLVSNSNKTDSINSNNTQSKPTTQTRASMIENADLCNNNNVDKKDTTKEVRDMGLFDHTSSEQTTANQTPLPPPRRLSRANSFSVTCSSYVQEEPEEASKEEVAKRTSTMTRRLRKGRSRNVFRYCSDLGLQDSASRVRPKSNREVFV